MGLGWRRSRARNGGVLVGFGAVRDTRGLGSKRVGISKELKNEVEKKYCCFGDEARPPLKRQCSEKLQLGSGVEDLPQELLIRVLCGVEHGDLKQLVLVSKSVMEAALVAKRMHFEYSTPTKDKAFRNNVESENLGDELEAPGAPRRSRKCRRRISLMTEVGLSVPHFQSDDDIGADEVWG